MKYYIFFILSLFSFNSYAHSGCGMHLSEEEIQKEFLYRDLLYSKEQINFSGAKKVDGLITIPVKVHIIRDSAGNNDYNLLTLYTQFCELNEIYKTTGFYFYILPDINYVVDEEFINIGSTVPENQRFTFFGNMMYRYYQYGALNVYYTLGTGLCGMAPFPSMTDIFNGRTGLLMEASNSCSGVGKKTLAHELGHHFGLFHTFQGYESRDSRYHEYVTRTEGIKNCHTAGDGFCDTPADILDYTCPYTGNATDLRGDRYNPDMTLIMSYHADNCQYRFSDEQNAFMNRIIRTDTSRMGYTRNQLEEIGTTPITTTLLPENNTDVYVGDTVTFSWNESPDADAYIFSILTGSNNLYYQTFLSDVTSFKYAFEAKDRGRTLYWRVTPVKKEIVCLNTTERKSFKVISKPTSVVEFQSAQLKVYPNPLTKGDAIHIEVGDLSKFKGQNLAINIVSLSGQNILELKVDLQSNIFLKFDQPLATGSYILNLKDEDQVYTTKLIIQ